MYDASSATASSKNATEKVREWIGGADAEQKAGEKAAGGKRAGQTDRDACQCERHSFARIGRTTCFVLQRRRDPDADLACAA